MRDRPLILLAAVLLAAVPSVAQVANGDFSAGLAGWVPVGFSGNGYVQASPFGNPADAARLFNVITPFAHTDGSAWISQTFACEADGAGGSCDIRFDRIIETNGPPVHFTVHVDDLLMHDSTHMPAHPTWVPQVVRVGCGMHTLKFTASAPILAADDDAWSVHIDNVVGVCGGGVPDDRTSFGAIKARYR